jgi:hypothetical protein
MPSQEVIDNLKQLQDELQTISPAIKHINHASEVVKKVGKIASDFSTLTEEIKTSDIELRKNLINEFKNQLKSFENHINETNNLLKTESNKFIKILNSSQLEKFIKLVSENSLNINIARIEEYATANNAILDSVQHNIIELLDNLNKSSSNQTKQINEFKNVTYDSHAEILLKLSSINTFLMILDDINNDVKKVKTVTASISSNSDSLQKTINLRFDELDSSISKQIKFNKTLLILNIVLILVLIMFTLIP